MNPRAFRQVDVFTAEPFMGNPVAVVLDADGLSDADMQRIARWTNLSETTFVLPASRPGADYRLRIFTPLSELPFAGHPTLGSAHALLEAGRVSAQGGALVQECGAGLVRLAVTSEGGERWIAFELPPASVQLLDDATVAELSSLLGAALVAEARPCLVDIGPRWVVAQLPDAAAALALQPDRARLVALSRALGATGVTVFGEYAPGEPSRLLEVRSFAPAQGIDEDPVCGSGNGAVGVFLQVTGRVERTGVRFLASQGLRCGRAGRVRLVLEGERVQVGGQAVTCVEGILTA